MTINPASPHDVRRGPVRAAKALHNFERLAAAGADPELVVGWTNKALAAQHAAQAELAATPARTGATEADIRTLVARLGDVSAVLAEAKPDDKAALYASFRLVSSTTQPIGSRTLMRGSACHLRAAEP